MSLANQREDFLLTLATFKAEKLEEYNQALSSLFPAEGNPFESDADKTSFLKSFLRNLRIFLEHQMEKATRDGSNLYTRDTHELLNFTFWSARRSYIDEINAFIVMEDIYDCLSMEEISAFFEFLEELVNLYGTFTQNQQQAMMRICNNILKKFSKVHDNDFRGRVQLVLSKITSVWEQTAVNLKSNLNLANSTSYSSTFRDEDSLASKQFKTKDFKELSNLRISFGLYMKFWELQKFLQNPALLLSDEASIILEDESALEPGNDVEVMEIENINGEALGKSSDNKDPKETKVTAFCRFASDIIDIFRKDPLLGPESMLRQKNYPKYLTKYSLLNIQLKDPSFRKSWLTQVIYCLWNLQNPLKLAQTAQKKGPEIKEADLEKVKALEKKVSEYIKEIPSLDGDSSSLNTQLQFFLEREKNWMQWKETGCKSFEKAVPDTLANFSKKLKDQTRLATEILDFQVNQAKNEVYPNYKEKEPYFNLIRNTSDKFLKDTGFDKDNSVFSFLHKPQLPQQIQALEPSANYYFNTFLSEMKDPTLTEEDKLSGDTTTVWRALRVLARNCINQFTTPGKTDIVELKLDDILKKMSKNEANPSEKPEGEGQPGEEKKKEEVKKDETMKEVKEPSSAGLGDDKSEMKVEKEVKKDVKPVEKMVVEPKVIETKSGEHKEEKVIERHKEPITLSKSDSKTEKEKITERIKSKVSEGEKGAEKTIHLSTSNRKRSPENDVKEYEKQPPGTKKPKT